MRPQAAALSVWPRGTPYRIFASPIDTTRAFRSFDDQRIG